MTQATPRRLLIAVTGLTPQIVTETLHALACDRPNPWIPQEVHLITTATGADNARLNLLAGGRWFHRLRADYQLPPILFTPEQIHVLQDAAGQPLDDIRSQADNTRAADFITETLRQLTADPDTELHVSIAGGRKTMGYYLGYALSLYGRPQDRLSHVLVSDPYETNRDFYYPTPYEHPIHSRRGDKEITVDARNARVDLADIPFVRLRDGLPERLRTGQASFTRVVATANRSLEAPRLVLEVATRQAWADDEPLDLSETEFLVLLWLAERAARGEAATDLTDLDTVREFLALAERTLPFASASRDRIASALSLDSASVQADPSVLKGYFRPLLSRIKTKFEEVLGERATQRYLLKRASRNHRLQAPLLLEPEQIDIRRA